MACMVYGVQEISVLDKLVLPLVRSSHRASLIAL
jgi:hypothetical protein